MFCLITKPMSLETPCNEHITCVQSWDTSAQVSHGFTLCLPETLTALVIFRHALGMTVLSFTAFLNYNNYSVHLDGMQPDIIPTMYRLVFTPGHSFSPKGEVIVSAKTFMKSWKCSWHLDGWILWNLSRTHPGHFLTSDCHSLWLPAHTKTKTRRVFQNSLCLQNQYTGYRWRNANHTEAQGV